MTRLLRLPPRLTLALLALLLLLALLPLRDLRLGAGLRELALREEPALQLEQAWAERFGDGQLLAVLFEPRQALLAPAGLAALEALHRDLSALPGVARVSSLLDAAAPAVTPRALDELLAGNYPTLRQHPPLDAAGRAALRENPLYRELLIGHSGTHAALYVSAAQGVSAAALVAPVRQVLQRHAAAGALLLTGEAAIAADLTDALRRELPLLALLSCVIVVLVLLFWLRHPAWCLLQIALTAFSCLPLLSLLAWQQHALTPVLLTALIIVALLALQQTQQFARCWRGLACPPVPRLECALRGWLRAAAVSTPALAAVFALLHLQPVAVLSELGTLVAVGALLTLPGLPLLAIPLLTLWPPRASAPAPPHLAGSRRMAAQVAGAVLLLVALALLPRLQPAPRLLDYFNPGSEPHRALTLLDREFGGSEPLQLTLARPVPVPEPPAMDGAQAWAEEDPFADPFAEPSVDPFAEAGGGDPFTGSGVAPWWFRRAGLGQLAAADAVLRAEPAVGKVLSLGLLRQLLRDQLGGEPDDIQLALAQRQLPALPRELLLRPFLDPQEELTRMVVQLRDVLPAEARELRDRLEVALGLAPDQLQFAGLPLAHQRLQAALPQIGLHALGLALLVLFAAGLLGWRSLRAALWLPLPGLCGGVAALGAMAVSGAYLSLTTLPLLLAMLALGGAAAAQRLTGDSAAGSVLLPAAAALPPLGLSALLPAVDFGLFGAFGIAVAAITALLLPAPRLLPLPGNDSNVVS